MKLKNNSFTLKFYKWFYRISDNPKNFCPYFWKSMFAYIMTSVFSPFLLLYRLYEIILNEFESISFWTRLTRGIILAFISFLMICMVFSILSLFNVPYFNFPKHYIPGLIPNMIVTGFVIWAIVIGIVLIWLLISSFNYIQKKISRKKIKKEEEKKTYIVIEAIKAFYHKHCPIIEWE